MATNRAILHMDLDTFFVSCERKLDSSLNNKPILIGGTSDRGVVASCSYEARRFGVHSAMPMRMAMERCPEAIVIKGNSSIYSKYSKEVSEIIKDAAPVYEIASIDEFYVDMTGMDQLFGCMKYAEEMRARIIRETGLPISFGLSENKTVSKIATGEAKPNDVRHIRIGTERDFLRPLSVQKIPMVGMKTYRTFREMGIERIETLQDMPLHLMEKAFGQNGVSIWKKAQGIDTSKVIQYSEQKSISTERTFDKDTIDVGKLQRLLSAMTENLTYKLRQGQKLTSCISVKVRYSDFQTHTLQKKVPYTSADHIIMPLVQELFEKLYDRRVLVRLVGVTLSELVNGTHQFRLFEESDKLIALYDSMDKVRNRFGDRAVMRAFGMEARTLNRPNPFTGDAPRLLLPNRRH